MTAKKRGRKKRNPGWFHQGFDPRRHLGFTVEECKKGYASAMAGKGKCKGQDGTWRPSTSHRVHDVPVLLYLLSGAYDWVTAQRVEQTDTPF